MKGRYDALGFISGGFFAFSAFDAFVMFYCKGDGFDALKCWVLGGWFVVLMGSLAGLVLARKLHDSVQANKLRWFSNPRQALWSFVLGFGFLSSSILFVSNALTDDPSPEQLASRFPTIEPQLDSLVQSIDKGNLLRNGKDRKLPNSFHKKLTSLGIDSCERGYDPGGEIDFLIHTFDTVENPQPYYIYFGRTPKGTEFESLQHLRGHWYLCEWFDLD
jgi:hypothetical protein